MIYHFKDNFMFNLNMIRINIYSDHIVQLGYFGKCQNQSEHEISILFWYIIVI